MAEDVTEIRQRRDVAYVYYISAIVSLSSGDLAGHDALIRRANGEIDSAIALIQERIKSKTH